MLRVKFITKNHGARDWMRQIPGGKGIINGCQFIFDSECESYDWLVVYDDFPKQRSGKAYRYEALNCAPSQTILVTSEPASIKYYEPAYVDQFAVIWTSQGPRDLRHTNVTRGPSTSLWYYGQGGEDVKTIDQMFFSSIPEKRHQISTVCSSKAQKHTLHRMRWEFTQFLKHKLPELQIFGHGVRPIGDKAEAMDAYRYHIAIENEYSPHHWTEKLSDCFLAGCLPFYYGCPNLEEYFPKESFIRIDIKKPQASFEIISDAIQSRQYARRLDDITEARRLVLEDHNLFNRLSIRINREPTMPKSSGYCLYSRHAARLRSPLSTLMAVWKKRGRLFT